jgi:transposase
MKIPLVYEENNPKYRLLDSIFIIMDSREIKQELSRNGLTPVNSVLKAMKIKLISLFFDINSKYIIDEINNSPVLRKRWNIKSILDYGKFSKLLSRLSSDSILEFVLKVSNKQFIKGKRGRKTILLDATPIMLDINLDKKFYNEEELAEKGFEIGFSKTHGYFIGGKLTLAIDFQTG